MRYPYNEWIQDVGWYFHRTMDSIATGGADRTLQPEFDAYFAQKYANPEEREFYRRRLAAALTYIRAHEAELYRGVSALVGGDGGLVSRTLMVTLHRIYAECSDEDLAEEPPLPWVLERAKETQEAFSSAPRGA